MSNLNVQFAEALFPPTRKVLGLRLKPFSYGHLTLLESINSPFLYPFGKPKLEDFLMALVLCSRPVEQAYEYLEQGFPLKWRVWMFYAAIGARNRYEAPMATFHLDLLKAVGFRIAGTWKNSKLLKESTAPGFSALTRALMHHYHFSHSEMKNMPIALVEFYHSVYLEHESAISFKNKDDDRLMDLHNRIQKGEFNGPR